MTPLDGGMVTTVFVECVSCGKYEELFDHETDELTAKREAGRRGWTVGGYRGATNTRCPACRYHKRTDTQALNEGKLGRRAGRYSMPVRHP